MGMKQCLYGAAIACVVGLLQGGSCHFGTMGNGKELWLHDAITLAGMAVVLEERTPAVYKAGKLVTATESEILKSAVGDGAAKAIIGGASRILAAREREATRVTNSAAAKGGKAKGGRANAENADADADASADAYAEGGDADAEATGIEINFPDDPCLTGDCD